MPAVPGIALASSQVGNTFPYGSPALGDVSGTAADIEFAEVVEQ